MNELKRVSGDALETIGERPVVRNNNEDNTEGENLAGIDTDTYDALDYRLMGTFPASDAVAQY